MTVISIPNMSISERIPKNPPPDFEPSPPVSSKWTKEPYHQYLKSKHWRNFRKRALEYYGRKCYLCGVEEGQIDLHHNTYERIGGELMSDVIPLCHTHHEMYESWERGATL